jgi:DNA repair protein SbcC/Rad50
MILKHVLISNFRKFVKLDLDISSGVIGIIGKNGAGKSTLLEIFAWLLYGSAGLKTKNVHLFPDFIEPKGLTEGELDFEVGDNSFRVSRGLKHTGKSTAMLWLNDKLIATSTKEVNLEIENISGLDFKAFQTSFYTRQNELNLLGSLQAAERSKRLEEMLGLERTNIIINNIKGDIRAREGERKGLEHLSGTLEETNVRLLEKEKQSNAIDTKLLTLNQAVEKAQTNLSVLKSVFSELEKKREVYNRLESEKALEEQKLKAAAQRLKILHVQITTIESQSGLYNSLKAEVALIPELRQTLSGLEIKRLSHETRKIKQAGYDNLNITLEHQEKKGKILQLNIQKLKDQSTEYPIINNNIKELTGKIAGLRLAVSDLQFNLSKVGDQLKKLKDQLAQLENLGPDAVCNFCLRPFEGEISEIKDHFQQEMDKLRISDTEFREKYPKAVEQLDNTLKNKEINEKKRTDMESVMRDLSQAEGEIISLREDFKRNLKQKSELETELKSLAKVKFDPETFDEIKKSVDDLQKKETELGALSERMESLQKMRIESQEVTENTAIINNNINEVISKLVALEYSEKDYMKVKKELEKSSGEFRQKELELAECRKNEAVLKSEIEGLKRQLVNIDKARKRVHDITGELIYMETLIELIKELKTELASRIRPTLIKYSSDLLDRMSEGKFSELNLNENYEISIRDYGELCELVRFSGGEQDLANLSLRLSISKLLAQSSRLDAGFLILDEVFGSQDSFRKENILGAIGGLKDFFQQIFIITHVDDIKEAVQTLMTVEENSDGSSMVIIE